MSALAKNTTTTGGCEEEDEEWGLPSGPDINEGVSRFHPFIIELNNELHKYDCGDLDFE